MRGARKNPFSAQDLVEAAHEAFPKMGRLVDGREARKSVDDTDSIAATFTRYHVLRGIREVPLSVFSPTGYAAADDTARVARLAAAIAESGEVTPLIVVVDKEGVDNPYVLEGGHRISALHALGAKSLPALVVVDLDDARDDEELAAAGGARKNPFKAQAKFKGKAARLKTWEGGFHTALNRDQTIPYAQMKWDGDEDDYPVILALDMGGITRFADRDSRIGAQFFYEHCKINQYDPEDPETEYEEILDKLDSDIENSEAEADVQPGDDALNAMWRMSDSPSVPEVAFRQGVQWIGGNASRLVQLYDIGKTIHTQGENIKLSRLDEEALIDCFGQCRYLQDISEDRLLQVFYMAPFFQVVVDSDGDEDEAVETAVENGFDLIEWGDTTIRESLTTAWSRRQSSLPLFEATGISASKGKGRIEYHGTSLKNLLLAAPALVSELPDPPLPCTKSIEEIAETLDFDTEDDE